MVPFNHWQVVLAQMYLLLLSVLVVYDPYSVLSDLITTCTYLLLRCLHIRQEQQPIPQNDYAFCIDLKDVSIS